MRNYILFTLLIFGLLIIGCGSKSGPDLSPEASRKTVKNLPDWYMNTPVKDGYQYSAAEATSQSMQLAVDKARVAAVSNLSQMIKSEWNGYTKHVCRKKQEWGRILNYWINFPLPRKMLFQINWTM